MRLFSLGRRIRFKEFVITGMRYYGVALAELRRNLGSELGFGILASMTTLCMFELLSLELKSDLEMKLTD